MSGTVTLVAWLSGGADSVPFMTLWALPLAYSLLVPTDRVAWLAGSSTSTAGMLALSVASNPSAAVIATHGLLAAAALLFAAVSTELQNRLHRSELQLERDRASALGELARAQRRMEHVDRLALLGEISASVAHEINNPLAFVRANVAFVRSGLCNPTQDVEEVRAALAESESGLARIEAIVHELRALARSDSGSDSGRLELACCEVDAAVKEALMFARPRLKSDISVTAALGLRLPPAAIHHQRLVQVLLNLIVNACDALREAPCPSPRIEVDAAVEGAELLIRVRDNGPGLSPAALARAFEPFFTTKPLGKGTGLGLSLSREYVEAAGGRLTVMNRSDGGACFTLRLPVASAGSAGK